MKPIHIPNATSVFSIADSALSLYVDAYSTYLQAHRYSSRTITRYVSGIEHFARWMSQNALTLQLVDEQMVAQFLNDHLPICNCGSPVMRLHRDLRAALGHLLRVLREHGAIAEQPCPTGPIAEELQRYDIYMDKVRGLVAQTRRNRLRTVQQLLVFKFIDGPVVIADLEPDELRQFIAKRLELHRTPSNAANLASALRAYFHYRSTGGDFVHSLLGVISSPANWSLASLPKALKPAEVEDLLASFTLSLSSPLRGFAMVRCALDMGLRCGEIAQIQLSDIDWRAGIVTLRGTKSRRQDVLPLPEVTGQALVNYIRNERPETTNQAIFVRCYAPRDQPIGVDAVRRVIRDAYQRIGLRHGRAHALRHTLANRLLEGGSSLKEVADVLRHRSLNTSLIYAKLDTPRLAEVALPWPGDSQ